MAFFEMPLGVLAEGAAIWEPGKQAVPGGNFEQSTVALTAVGTIIIIAVANAIIEHRSARLIWIILHLVGAVINALPEGVLVSLSPQAS